MESTSWLSAGIMPGAAKQWECARARVCKYIQNTKGKACSLGNHRLLYKEVCVISAYLGWWTRERLRARKIPFWHAHMHTFFLAVFKKHTIFVLWQYERMRVGSSGSDRVPSGSSGDSGELQQCVLRLFFLPPFRAGFAWRRGGGVSRREMPPGFNSYNFF